MQLLRLWEKQKDQTIPMDEEEKRKALVSCEMKKKRDVLREILPHYDYALFLFKKDSHLLKIGFLPLLLFAVSLYLLIRTSQISFLSEKDYLLNTLGNFLGVAAILSLIIIYTVDGVRTFKEWGIVKKQKAYLKEQRHPAMNKFIFVLLSLLLLVYISLGGVEAYQQLSSYFNFIVYIIILYFLYGLFRKKKPK